MKPSYVIAILLMFILTFTNCSDDNHHAELANTTWAAKVKENQIGVPKKYRERGSWVVHFTKKEFTVTIGIDGYEVFNMYNGAYYFVDENKAKGECTNGMIMMFELMDDGNYIYCPSLDQHLIRQKNH